MPSNTNYLSEIRKRVRKFENVSGERNVEMRRKLNRLIQRNRQILAAVRGGVAGGGRGKCCCKTAKGTRCTRNGAVEIGGNWYCKQHAKSVAQTGECKTGNACIKIPSSHSSSLATAPKAKALPKPKPKANLKPKRKAKKTVQGFLKSDQDNIALILQNLGYSREEGEQIKITFLYPAREERKQGLRSGPSRDNVARLANRRGEMLKDSMSWNHSQPDDAYRAEILIYGDNNHFEWVNPDTLEAQTTKGRGNNCLIYAIIGALAHAGELDVSPVEGEIDAFVQAVRENVERVRAAKVPKKSPLKPKQKQKPKPKEKSDPKSRRRPPTSPSTPPSVSGEELKKAFLSKSKDSYQKSGRDGAQGDTKIMNYKGRRYAVKTFLSPKKSMANVRKEADFQRRVYAQNPNAVPRVYGTFEGKGGVKFIIMDAMKQTLGDFLREQNIGKSLPTYDLPDSMQEDILAAFQACDDAGILHNDAKWQNIMLDDEGRVKIIDFGLSKELSSKRYRERGLNNFNLSVLSVLYMLTRNNIRAERIYSHPRIKELRNTQSFKNKNISYYMKKYDIRYE